MRETQRQTNKAKRPTGADGDSCVDWACVFPHPENFKRTDAKRRPTQIKVWMTASKANILHFKHKPFVKSCKSKDHKEEQITIVTSTKHLGLKANSTLALSKHLESFDF